MSPSLSWMSWWNDADWVVRGVFVLLVALSVASWAMMLYKALRFRQLIKGEELAARRLDGGTHPRALAETLAPDQPTARLIDDVLVQPDADPRERLEVAVRGQRLELESGLTLLATIANTAPFIGLFGTVWGIMHALHGLGGGRALTMDMVAGPVAEALVATAAGLFTALPAVAGYNLLLRRQRVIANRIDANAARLLSLAVKASGDGTVVALHPGTTRRT